MTYPPPGHDPRVGLPGPWQGQPTAQPPGAPQQPDQQPPNRYQQPSGHGPSHPPSGQVPYQQPPQPYQQPPNRPPYQQPPTQVPHQQTSNRAPYQQPPQQYQQPPNQVPYQQPPNRLPYQQPYGGPQGRPGPAGGPVAWQPEQSPVGIPLQFTPAPPQTVRRPRRPGAVHSMVWVVVVVVLALAALATLFVIGLTTGPAGSIVGLLLAILPVFPVAATLLWLDSYESEPPALLAFAFAWGATAAVVISLIFSIGSMIVISGAGGGDLLGAILVAPVVEESAKALAIVGVLLIRRRQFNGVVDGIVYAGLSGLGFAFAENILYLGSAFLDGGMAGAVVTFVLRGVMGPFAHPMFTAATGIGIGMAVRTNRLSLRILFPAAGLAVAMLLHSLWNTMASLGGTGQWFIGYVLVQVPIFAGFVAFAVVVRRREGRLIAQHLSLYAQSGWITGQELAMLASPGGRRQARAWAKRVGGSTGRRAMRDFQELASELAFLRERMARHTAPTHAQQTEADLLRSMWHIRHDFQPAT